MMYRPKDWNNPHEIEYKPGINSAVDVAEGIAFEAGADAMLEALRKGGRCLEDGQLVFIPADTP